VRPTARAKLSHSGSRHRRHIGCSAHATRERAQERVVGLSERRIQVLGRRVPGPRSRVGLRKKRWAFSQRPLGGVGPDGVVGLSCEPGPPLASQPKQSHTWLRLPILRKSASVGHQQPRRSISDSRGPMARDPQRGRIAFGRCRHFYACRVVAVCPGRAPCVARDRTESDAGALLVPVLLERSRM
jgi:hypothetical protein